MTDNESTYPDDDLMEAYIHGTLGADERAALEQRMAADPEVAQKIVLHRKVVQVAQAARRKRMREQFLEHFDSRERIAKVESTGFMGLSKRTSVLVAGAATVVLLVLYGALIFRFGEESGKKWASQHPIVVRDTMFVQNPPIAKTPLAEKPKLLPRIDDEATLKVRQIAALLRPPTPTSIRRGETNAPDTLLERSWQEGRYKETMALAESYLRDSTTQRALELYGDAAFKTGNYALAESAYTQLNKYNTWQEAKWNLLLCYAMQLPDRKAKFDSLAQEIGKWDESDGFEKDLNRLLKIKGGL